MFDRIAPRYDLLNRVLSAGIDRRWRQQCIDYLGLAIPSRVLDVCTGTADLLIEFMRRDREHTGVGLDLSSEMLGIGARKISRAGYAGRAWLLSGDAQALPFPDGSFDGAFIGFGIRNVGDPRAALRELRRVLRPGSPLVILEFAMPPGVLGSLYRLYFGRLLPWVGGVVSGNASAYRYLPDSVARFPTPEAFARLMEEAGFASVRRRPLTGGIAFLHRAMRPAA
jgi:demethylmenaquinone methyltransferase/2-methoxy-6-polyprenyl-1,4-benzoquinol methylase